MKWKGTASNSNQKSSRGRIPAFSILFLLTVGSISAQAQTTINQGDVVVVFAQFFGGFGAILKVDPITGAQTVIACNPGTTGGPPSSPTCPIVGTPGYLSEPVSLAIESTGNIVVADREGVFGVGPSVIRVNPQTGAQQLLASGPPLIDPFGITVGGLGVIYITDTGCAGHGTNCPSGTSNAKVYSINPNGPFPVTPTLISTGQFLRNPFGIDAELNGNLVVTDAITGVPPFTGAGGLIEINITNPSATTTTNQTPLHVSTANVDGCPFGVAVDSAPDAFNGQIYNSLFHDPSPPDSNDAAPFPPFGCAPGAIWRDAGSVNTFVSGRAQSIKWKAPFGMVVDANTVPTVPPIPPGSVLVVDEFYMALYRVNQNNGNLFSPVPLSQFNQAPTDVDVYTTNNTPAPLTGADVSVTKTDGLTTVTAGDPTIHTYTISVHNGGPLDAINVSLNDTWPSGFVRGTTATSQGSCTSGTGDFTCSLGTITSGSTVTITANYTVPSTTPPGAQTNTATASSTTPDPNSGNNTGSDTTTVVTNADLSVTKTDGLTTVTAGDGVTHMYTITVSNAGPSQAAGVNLTDTWPGGFVRGMTTPSQGSCTSGTGNFTCSLGTINSGSSVTITANYTVPSTTPAGDQTNSATVSSSTPDSNSANNTGSDTTTVVAIADLSVSKTDGITTVTAGDGASHTYTITVTNNGPSQATNVILTDTWPSGFNRTSLSCTPATGATTGNGNFTCNLGTLGPSGTTTVTANYTVPATTSGQQTNTAQVGSDASDNNTANNTSSDTDNVNPPAQQADLMISKADRPDPVATGATLVYTLTVRNNGPNTANSVTVTDNLPATVTFQSASGSGWNCTRSGQTVTCTRPSLNPGVSTSIEIDVTAPSQPGTIVNTASVASATFDPVPGNNSDSETTTVIQAVTPFKWEGSGKIAVPGGSATFGFQIIRKKNGVIQGHLDFDNLVTKLDADSITITSATVSGNTLTFSGTVKERVGNGPWNGPYNFTVTAQDNGDPGKGRDFFRIQISDPFATNSGGTLTAGNIKQDTFDSRDDKDDRE